MYRKFGSIKNRIIWIPVIYYCKPRKNRIFTTLVKTPDFLLDFTTESFGIFWTGLSDTF